MPNYLYRREDNTHFEAEQGMNDDALTECPNTGQPCKRIITGGHGPLLPFEKSIKYIDGNFINSNLAKKLEENKFYTSLPDKRERLKENTEKARQYNAEQKRKITGRISEI